MLSEALVSILIYLRYVMKHSSSNECLSLWRIILFPRLTWCPILVILLEIWDFVWHKWHCVDHKRFGYAVTSSSNHSYTSKAYQEALKGEIACLSLWHSITFPMLIWCPKRVILLKLRGAARIKDAVLTRRGLDMLLGALSIICIYLVYVMKHTSSNGCLSLWHSIIFPVLIWCVKLDILLEIGGFFFA